ncbi:delta and Notch-like epidermal growth factor-related receptor [Magallana gigas]|uniref:delta and Notch-like epidermal growth factor-related receptor n=1 Tax=Magallana gigas TaxID=29159 RepID=UPI003342D664
MIHPKWIVLVGLLCCAHCYENLSRRPTTVLTQSSTYNGQTASFANDGNLQTDDLNCSHTAPNNTKAWLQVDFGESYSINNVKIYYRRDGNRMGEWKQFRFRQFYLDISNSSATQTATLHRTRCYTDNTAYPNLPPNIIDIPCKQTARYVIVETTYDALEDNVFGAILEVCELEVYGCETTCRNNVCDGVGNCTDGCVDGYWGPPACNFKCPADCKEPNCIMYSGQCNSCKSGFWGDTCSSLCPLHCIGRVCDKNSGSCTKGCTSGPNGDTCNRTCSPWCVGGICDKQSATCFNGCVQNYAGSQCDEYDSNHYGFSCSLECNHNCVNSTCNGTTGLCTLGCKRGFYGYKCDRQCTCCPSGCDRLTGRCNGDCPVGKQSPVPNTENMSSLYVVITALCISLLVNIFTIIWIFRNKACKRQDVNQEKKKDTDSISIPGMYDTADENAGYQELGQLSGPSHYDHLQGPATNK